MHRTCLKQASILSWHGQQQTQIITYLLSQLEINTGVLTFISEYNFTQIWDIWETMTSYRNGSVRFPSRKGNARNIASSLLLSVHRCVWTVRKVSSQQRPCTPLQPQFTTEKSPLIDLCPNCSSLLSVSECLKHHFPFWHPRFIAIAVCVCVCRNNSLVFE